MTTSGKRTHLNRLRYAWAKEQVSSEHHHYHCVLIFNKDAHYELGDYDLNKPTLAYNDNIRVVQCVTARIRPYHR
ncbi:inovirus-type Gp2 protein [Providencia rettgeri]|uniref:YagK/YfjJ domain-containing protein n=1 Tax=Providencia rettgeri TaxID=587 RepID=UPI0034E0678E